MSDVHQEKISEIKILTLGATGSGKSALLNLLYEFSKDREVEKLYTDKKTLIKTAYFDGLADAERNNNTTGGKSCTLKPTPYYFLFNSDNKNYKIKAIDSPGLGDTEGIEQDDKNLDDIINVVIDNPDLNAIILVMNGSDPRIHSRIKYIVYKIFGIIPDTLSSILYVLYTNCRVTPNLNLQAEFDFKITDHPTFTIDNLFFSVDPEKFMKDQLVKKKVKRAFEEVKEDMMEFFTTIFKTKQFKTEIFIKIRDERALFKKSLWDLNKKQAQIQEEKINLKNLISEANNKNNNLADLEARLFTKTIAEEYISIKINHYNTTCLECKKVCHENCSLDEVTIKGSDHFLKCFAFNGGKCQVCKCGLSPHTHLRERYEMHKVEKTIVDTKIQEEVNNTKNYQEKRELLIKTLENKIKLLDDEYKNNITKKIPELVSSLQKTCSQFNYLREIEALKKLIEEDIESELNIQSTKKTKEENIKQSRKKVERLQNVMKSCMEIWHSLQKLVTAPDLSRKF